MKKIVYLLPFSLLFIGCQDEEGVKQVELDLSNETSEESINKVVYTIHSPNEQFDLLQNIGGELNLLLIHDLESLDKYSSPKSISLNLGVYTADASYMMRYNQGKSVFMNYVSGLDRLRRIYNNYREVQKGINAADVLEDEGILKYGGGLRRWFKEEWTDVKTGEPCGRESASDSSRPYPYCRPANKVSSETPATTKHPEAKKRAKSKTGPTTRVKPITR